MDIESAHDYALKPALLGKGLRRLTAIWFDNHQNGDEQIFLILSFLLRREKNPGLLDKHDVYGAQEETDRRGSDHYVLGGRAVRVFAYHVGSAKELEAHSRYQLLP